MTTSDGKEDACAGKSKEAVWVISGLRKRCLGLLLPSALFFNLLQRIRESLSVWLYHHCLVFLVLSS